jgi:hypothetical protein
MMGQETVESPEAQLDQTKADSAQRVSGPEHPRYLVSDLLTLACSLSPLLSLSSQWLDEARTAAKEQMKVSFAPKTMDVTRKHIEVGTC